MDKVIFLPVIYEGSRDLKDRTKKLVFQTNEVTPEQAGTLQQMVQQFGYLALKKEDFTRDEINIINDLKTTYDDSSKTPSQRLRAVIYRLWEQNKEGYDNFEDYYRYSMDKIITHLKSKLV